MASKGIAVAANNPAGDETVEMVSKCFGGDTCGEAFFSYGPLEDFESVELSSASSTFSDREDHGDPDNILGDPWSDKEILESIEGQPRVIDWERRRKTSPYRFRRADMLGAAPQTFKALSNYAVNSHQPAPALEPDMMLSSLVQLAFGRESTLYRYHEKKGSFRIVSGDTPHTTHDLTNGLIDCGNQMRRANQFSEKIQRSKDSVASLVALASGVDIALRALDASMSASLSSVKTALKLQELLEAPRQVLETISSIILIVDQAGKLEDDAIVLSKIFDVAQDLECSVPQLRTIISELLAHVTRPWLEAVETSIGLKEVGLGAFSLKRQSRRLNECNPKIADACIEVEENSPQKMPAFISTDLTEVLLEAQDSLQLLQTYEPRHLLARPQELSLHEPPVLQWQFSWQDIERVEAQALTYESNILEALKEFHQSGSASSASHHELDQGAESSAQSPETAEVYDSPWDIDAPLSSLLLGSQSCLATTITQTLSDTPPPPQTPKTPPMSLLPMHSFAPILTAQSRLLSHSTLLMLFRGHELSFHLRLLRSYLLFGNGGFLVRLSQALPDPILASAKHGSQQSRSDAEKERSYSRTRETMQPRSSELRITLTEILTESYYSSVAINSSRDCDKAWIDKAELPGELSFAMPNDMSEEEFENCMNADGLEALSFLNICYQPPKPLHVVITDNILEKYNLVSQLLMRGAWVGRAVRGMVKQNRDNGRSMPGSRLAQRFKMEAHHFVTTVFGYFGDSIEELWIAFATRLDSIEARIDCYEIGQKIEGVHRLRELHEEVLDRILACCLLRKRQEPVMHLLEEILGLVLRFASMVRQTKGDEEARDIYEIWKTKVRVFITVCRGLQNQVSLAGNPDVFDGGELGKEDGNGIGRLVLRLEMNGWYMR
ncbi:MAG: hypothetical protein Q9168_003066 [Polycauliona sp. 1 TL-2023]